MTQPDFEGAIPVNEVLARCNKIKVMSSIDLTCSFWQIPLAEESRDFTGFLYNRKCYGYTVTLFMMHPSAFGLKTSLANLTRELDKVLPERVKQFTIVRYHQIYVDDILIVSQNTN